MVYNEDPIDKEKAIEKTYEHLQELEKRNGINNSVCGFVFFQ